MWEGKCFVFDQRLISDVDPKSGTISKCVWCGESSDRYSNCKNPGCDDLVIMCQGCARKESGCCSGACVNEYKRLIMIKSRERQGYKFRGTA